MGICALIFIPPLFLNIQESRSMEEVLVRLAFSRPFHLPSPFRPIVPCCFLSGLHPFALSATVHALSKTGPYRTYGFLTDFPNTTSYQYLCFSMHLACPSFAIVNALSRDNLSIRSSRCNLKTMWYIYSLSPRMYVCFMWISNSSTTRIT